MPTMITEEEERRISAATAISASATAFRRCHCLSTEHLRCNALMPPDFKEEAIDMEYDHHGINPGRLYATYFVGDRGLVAKANKKAWGCWLKHLPEDVIIGCPARDNFWEVRGFCSRLILSVIVTSSWLCFCFWGRRSAFLRIYCPSPPFSARSLTSSPTRPSSCMTHWASPST